jgi:CDP-2,3-bis-(O-geranylgeranyl)-sn-glycerol synthase
MTPAPDGLASALWLVTALSVAGVAHVLWLKSRWSARFAQPVDGGRSFRGRRLFGDNKQLRGFLMMPVASAAAFAALAATRPLYPEPLARGFWDLPVPAYAFCGFVCGLAFMLAELPNSFLKRQLGVGPGETASSPWLRPVCLVLDRADSTLGVLAALSLLLPTAASTWLWALLLGPTSHALFSGWLYRAAVKARPL